MSKRIAKQSISAAIAAGFIVMLIFVSLLGENNNVNDTVASFYKHIKAHDYGNASTYVTADAIDRFTTSSGMDFEDYAFVLELALLSHYNLIDKEDYRVVISRESFWIPYMNNATVKVGVFLKAKGKSLLENLQHLSSPHKIHGLFTVERVNGIWKITQIQLQDPPLSNRFTTLAARLKNTHGVITTKTGFRVEGLRYDPTTCDDTLRHIYRHLLRKASRLLSADPGKETVNG